MAPPPAGPPPARPGPSRWPRRLLVTGWPASVVVAGAAAGMTLLLSLLLALAMRQPGMSGHETAVLMSLLAGGAFGADGLVGGGEVSGGVGAIPLTITLVVLAIAVWAFRRATSRCRDAVVALGVAIRAGLLTGLVLMVVALSLRASVGGSTIRASAAGAFLLTFVGLAGVLAVAVLLRRDWLRSPVARALHDRVRAPLVGLATMLCLLPFAGAIAALAVLVLGGGTSDYTAGYGATEWRGIVAGSIAYAGNAGLWAVTLGAGGRVGLFGLDDLETLLRAVSPIELPTGGRLGWFTGTFHEPGLWVCVVLTPAVLALGAYAAVRAARSASSAPAPVRGLALWVLSLLAAVPWATRLANVHVHADVDDFGIHVGGGLGASGLGATFLLLGYAAVVAVVVGWATAALDRRSVRAAATALGARLQQTGGATRGVARPPAAYVPGGTTRGAGPPGPSGPPPASPPTRPPSGPQP